VKSIKTLAEHVRSLEPDALKYDIGCMRQGAEDSQMSATSLLPKQ